MVARIASLDPPGLIAIVGPTATGKTRLAIALAAALHAPILSADSRQVYRRLDIGTAKPTLEERQGIPHYLIDLVEPDAAFTLADYQAQAQQLIAAFHARGITPILVGGTGLYVKAITQGLGIPRVPPQPVLRQQLADLGQSRCYALLGAVDPPSAQRIHPRDAVRTARALEVFYTTGQPLSQLQAIAPPQYPICQIGLNTPPPDTYRQRVRDRVVAMLERGWLREIQQLQADYGADLPLLRTLGYGEMADYLAGRWSLEAAIAATTTHTLQFAKRQRTWFRGREVGNIHWLEGSEAEPLDALVAIVAAVWGSPLNSQARSE